MNHGDHVRLLRPANLSPGGTWADFGAGNGAFTMALREILGAEAAIYAVDRDRHRLNELVREYRSRFHDTENLHILAADFLHAMGLPLLDGLVMANSLHFFADQAQALGAVRDFLKPEGILLLVEYNVDSGNMWVPHPLSFSTFQALAPRAGFSEPRLLARHPSSFLGEFYSALACRNNARSAS